MKILKNISFYRIVVIVFSLGITIPSMATYFQTVESLAKQGNAYAQIGLATMYYEGQGNRRDMIRMANRLAGLDNYVGDDFDNEGIPRDDKKAFEWFEKAANQGACRGSVQTCRSI